MNEYMPCLPSCDCVTTFRMVSSSSIHWLVNFKIYCFFCWLVAHCVNVPYFVYPFFDWGASRFLPDSSYYKCFFYEHSWTDVLVVWMCILWVCAWVKVLDLEVDCFPNSRESTILISKVSVQICPSTSNGKGFLVLHIYSSINCHWWIWFKSF